jgi:protein tyrosine phosphatase (PTP) superfamily phosphohydrolase (DUF442 family)
MSLCNKYLVVALCLFAGSSALAATDVTDIENYREYSPLFSSSGQPSAKQLKTVADEGFKRVIYIAFSDNKTAIEAEDRVVKSLGMDYVHIPVDWDHPTLEDFEDVAAVLSRDKTTRTLLHCQVNFRASTFSFLYRVIYAGVPMAEAKSDLDAIWQADKVWYQFVVEVLKQHGFSQECEGCDWGVNEFED